MPEQLIVPVILSGGAGTRLWPVSTPERPKQFAAMAGERTMLQMTADRVTGRPGFAPPMVVASAAHADVAEAQLASACRAAGPLILEPVGRNTAAAIALAALQAEPSALLLVMPSDHVILHPDEFIAAVARAAPLAAADWLVTFGVAPDRPETGYGYIRRGAPLAGGVYAVDRFVEKPDEATAASYLAEGGYDWNAGIFLLRAGALVQALAVHAPDILGQVRAAHAAGRWSGTRFYPDADAFGRVRSLSIDHAVMEPHDRVAVTPVDIGWSDLGSWDALHDLGAKDAAGNFLKGAVVARDARNCLLHSDGPKVIAAGIEDLIVVATKEAVMIVRRGDSQRVKELAGLFAEAQGLPR